MERKCNKCPAFYGSRDEGLCPNGAGWEKKEIDGQQVVVCRPGSTPNRKRTMQKYCFYCLATPTGKKIGDLAGWSGRTPIWCPLGREVQGNG